MLYINLFVNRSTHTRYWSIHDVQRYFFGDLHCEKVLFTYQYPNLRMPSQLGSYFWRANTALKLPPALYQKEFNRSLEVTLKKIEATQAQMDRIMISDQLIKLDRLDMFKRKSFFRILMNIM
ncbi:Xaa-Pro dipeptidase, partial [Operophtera brumata]